jgi:phospholipid transport system substrate-binding protein
MRQIVCRFVLVLIGTCAAPFAFAQAVAPDALLKAVTQEVLEIIRQDKEIQAGNPARAAELVESKILPHFDFPHMTQIAVARNWRLATAEQQKALAAEFRTLLVRTYSTALASYRDQVIEFRPLRSAPGDTEVTIKSVIKQPGTAPLTIDYDMEKTAAGWKVYDIKIEGISMITTYRETFAGIVRDGGVEGLIRSLAEKNSAGRHPGRRDQQTEPGDRRSGVPDNQALRQGQHLPVVVEVEEGPARGR